MFSHRIRVDKDLILLSAFIAHLVKSNMIGEKDIEKVGIQTVSSSKVTRCITKEQILNSHISEPTTLMGLYIASGGKAPTSPQL